MNAEMTDRDYYVMYVEYYFILAGIIFGVYLLTETYYYLSYRSKRPPWITNQDPLYTSEWDAGDTMIVFVFLCSLAYRTCYVRFGVDWKSF